MNNLHFASQPGNQAAAENTPAADNTSPQNRTGTAPPRRGTVTRAMLDELAALAPPKKQRVYSGERPAPTAADAVGAALPARIRNYLAAIPGAVSGERGHDRTFRAACKLVLGFALTPEAAFPYLAEWNLKCEPPWSEYDLHRKLTEADKQCGERGYLLAELQTESTPGIDLSGFETLFSQEVAEQHECASTLVSYKSQETNADAHSCCHVSHARHAPETPPTPAEIAASIIGRQPEYRECPHCLHRLMEGCADETADTDLFLQVSCKGWHTCYVCRDRRRYAEKLDNVPIALKHGTHVFRGTAIEWNAYRKRLYRAGANWMAYSVAQAEGQVVVIVGVLSDPDAVPKSAHLQRVTGEEAARALARAVNAVPDDLAPTHGQQRIRRFNKSTNWVMDPDSESTTEQVESTEQTPAFTSGDQCCSDVPAATPTPAEPAEEILPAIQRFRAVKGVPLLSISGAEKVLRRYGITYKRGALIDAPLMMGGSVEDSLCWTADLDCRMDIRREIMGRREPEWSFGPMPDVLSNLIHGGDARVLEHQVEGRTGVQAASESPASPRATQECEPIPW